jgi:hypothetical protein
VWLVFFLVSTFALMPRRATAQAWIARVPDALAGVVDPADRTGTNPADFRDTLDLWNDFRSVGDGLFFDEVTWQYGKAFAGNRMRVRAQLPLQLANITGRTEAGFGDVVAGWESLPVVRGRVAWLAGIDMGFDTATNLALTTSHTVLAPSTRLAFALRRNTVLSVGYTHLVSLNSVEDVSDINEGAFETSIVHRFGDGTWIRAVPAIVLDHERRETWGRLDGEWGRILSGGASTWVRAGGVFGAPAPYKWSVAIGFRFVQ